ncbi:hypothetical protein ERJ75_001440100 [Trypanosoma vivax]|uniref:Uncharacterized protein n=1 Tax=Trypanosoma vivax (strain Y486) TaxID=1055687 RepID=G0U8A2_TRYVY|nr:hypothetical protein TRVL_04245 [Trypanosoma vivax]KAH8607320.1 hypothetical protein ERJ75_001440100 [Trypanosoma vivax]CCC52112.1 conserved hypothetical protein [Trypanosoma vivax Y486]
MQVPRSGKTSGSLVEDEAHVLGDGGSHWTDGISQDRAKLVGVGQKCFHSSGAGHPDGSASALQVHVPTTKLSERQTLECLASIAYLVGSPVQRSQPTAAEPVQRTLEVVRELLRRGLHPEQIIQIIESREGLNGS